MEDKIIFMSLAVLGYIIVLLILIPTVTLVITLEAQQVLSYTTHRFNSDPGPFISLSTGKRNK